MPLTFGAGLRKRKREQVEADKAVLASEDLHIQELNTWIAQLRDENNELIESIKGDSERCITQKSYITYFNLFVGEYGFTNNMHTMLSRGKTREHWVRLGECIGAILDLHAKYRGDGLFTFTIE